MLLLRAGQALPCSAAARGSPGDPPAAPARQPYAAAGQAEPVGGMWSGPLRASASPCLPGLAARRVTPLPPRPRQAPAFLAKPGSGTRVRERGRDAASTGRLSPAAPAGWQPSPARPPEPARTPRSRAGGKGEVAAERGLGSAALQGTHLLTKGTELACSEGTGEQKGIRGGFAEARGIFPKYVFVCAQVRAFPAPERCLLQRSCLLWPHPRGLSRG